MSVIQERSCSSFSVAKKGSFQASIRKSSLPRGTDQRLALAPKLLQVQEADDKNYLEKINGNNHRLNSQLRQIETEILLKEDDTPTASRLEHARLDGPQHR